MGTWRLSSATSAMPRVARVRTTSVIDRKTLQLYPDADRPMAVQAVANRLAPTGVFVSHCHDGSWTPSAPRKHRLEPWFQAGGWRFYQPDTPLKGQVAWLSLTTG